jgi:predicted transcriptional regulator
MRRSRIDIVFDILRVAMKGSNKTHIVYETNLNFELATKYLKMLEEKGLISHENGIFKTTEKGKIFHDKSQEFKL